MTQSDGDLLELPQPPGPDPLWCENYLFHGYDPAQRIGFLFHLAQMQYNRDLWRELVWVFLPGGETYLLAKGFGEGGHPRGPGAAALRATCEEPRQRWRVDFSGVVREVTSSEAWAGTLADGVHEPAEMHLTFDGLGPIRDISSSMGNQTWADSHYEQDCAVRGELVFRDRTVTVDGTGVRDHSRGPRDVSPLDRHVFLTGQFPSGRRFGVFHVETTIGKHLSRAEVTVDGTSVEAEVVSAPLLTSLSGAPDPYVLSLKWPGGHADIQGTVLSTVPTSLIAPNEWVLGLDRSGRTSTFILESQARYEWDGETGTGLSERSFSTPAVDAP